MTRTDDEIRAEIAKWKAFVRDSRGDKLRSIDAAGAAIIVSALTWALGEISGPAVRVKI